MNYRSLAAEEARLSASQLLSLGHEVEWGAGADQAPSGRARTDPELPPEAEAEDPTGADVPAVVVFLPGCVQREFAGLARRSTARSEARS
jgi:hypothetical protein